MATVSIRADPTASFFIKRNGIIPITRKNWNYTNNSLSYMTPAFRADDIAQKIASVYSGREFLIIETCAGAGGTTLAFLDQKSIGLVVTYEGDPQRQLMLKRNITMYNFGAKAIVVDSLFGGGDFSPLQGCAMYFDPGAPDIGRPLTVSGKTIEQWLTEYKTTVYCFGAKIPPGFSLNPVEGWQMKKEDLVSDNKSQGTFYYGVSIAAAPAAVNNRGGLLPYDALLKNPQAPLLKGWVDPEPRKKPITIIRGDLPDALPPDQQPNVSGDQPYIRADPITTSPLDYDPEEEFESTFEAVDVVNTARRTGEPVAVVAEEKKRRPPVQSEAPVKEDVKTKWDLFCETLPRSQSRPNPDNGEWLKEFQRYIYTLLTPIITDKKILDIMVDEKAMPIWIRAFTHETYNAEFNYERLETKGDVLAAYVFSKYLWRRFPDITSQTITEYKNRYMTKEHQRQYGRQMKFGDWALVRGAKINDKIYEDIFESFFGALDDLSDKVKDGLGAVNAFNYFIAIFEDVTFDIRMARGKPKSIFQQYGPRLGWGKEGVVHSETLNPDGSYTITVSLSDRAFDYLRRIGVSRLRNPLGIGRGSKDDAENTAYTQALTKFNDVGLTFERIRDLSDQVKFSRMNQELVRLARTKAKAAGWDRIYFFIPRTTSGAQTAVVQLRGMALRSGQEVSTILIARSVPASQKESVREDLVREYVNKA